MSTSELGVLMMKMGFEPSDAELQDILASVDADSSGEVDFEEFLVLVKMVAKKNVDASGGGDDDEDDDDDDEDVGEWELDEQEEVRTVDAIAEFAEG